MTELELVRWGNLFNKKLTLYIDINRLNWFEKILISRQKKLNYKSLDHYYFYLIENDSLAEWDVLIDQITVHETRFNRDKYLLHFLRNVLKNDFNFNSKINIFSAGCSTGEEAFSIAFLLEEMGKKYEIDGVDISKRVVNIANKGVYSKKSFDCYDEKIRNKFLAPVDNNRFVIKKIINENVRFFVKDLLNLKSIKKKYHIVICKNVLIYFDTKIRIKILDKLFSLVEDKGYLLIGFGEGIGWGNKNAKSIADVRNVIYQKEERLN